MANEIIYTGKNDPLLNLPNNSFDLSTQSQQGLKRDFQVTVKNTHATGYRRVNIFENSLSNPLFTIVDGIIVYTAGATDLTATADRGTVKDWLYELRHNPQFMLTCDVSSDNIKQLDQYFEITRWDFYKNLSEPTRVKLNKPELRNQQDNKKIFVNFSDLVTSRQTELAIIIPPLTETIFNFQMGAAFSVDYIMHERYRASKASGLVG